MTRARAAQALAAAVMLMSGCSRGPSPGGAARPASGGGGDRRLKVAVTIAPHGAFAQRIAGDRASVQVLVPAGQDPHTYDVTPRALQELSGAVLYFAAGLEIEKALAPRIERLGSIRTVDLLAGIELAPGEGGAGDPHVWLSPPLALRQAAAMRDALAQADPAGREGYSRRFDELAAELGSAAERAAAILAPYRGRSFYVFHPSWGYFARGFGLNQVAVEVEGKEPTARQLAELVERGRSDRVRVVFARAHVSDAGARAFARELGASVVTLDDLAADPAANLVRVAEAIAASLR